MGLFSFRLVTNFLTKTSKSHGNDDQRVGYHGCQQCSYDRYIISNLGTMFRLKTVFSQPGSADKWYDSCSHCSQPLLEQLSIGYLSLAQTLSCRRFSKSCVYRIAASVNLFQFSEMQRTLTLDGISQGRRVLSSGVAQISEMMIRERTVDQPTDQI